MTQPSSSNPTTVYRRRDVLWLVGLMVVYAASSYLGRLPERLIITGDEPRYMMYAMAKGFIGKYVPGALEWSHIVAEHHVRFGRTQLLGAVHPPPPAHAIGLPWVGVGIATRYGPMGLRYLAWAIGAVGLVGLFLLVLSITGNAAWSAAISLFATLSLPLAPYLDLYLPDVVLFTLASWSLFLVLSERDLTWQMILGVLLAASAPWFHLRGAALSIAVLFFAAFQLIIRKERLAQRMMKIGILIGVVAAVALMVIIADLRIYGSIFGSVNTARPALSTTTAARTLLDFRHGLLTYSPQWLLAIAGVVLGLIHRKSWAIAMAVLLVVWSATSIGPNPGECWPARFAVQIMPVLAAGLAFWLKESRSWDEWLVAAILLSFGCMNSVLFFLKPNSYLENRLLSRVYFALHQHWHGMDFGFWVDSWSNHMPAVPILVGVSVLVALLAIRRHYGMVWVSGPTIVALLLCIEVHRVRPVRLTNVAWQKNGHGLVASMEGEPNGIVRVDLLPPWHGTTPNHDMVIKIGGVVAYQGPMRSPVYISVRREGPRNRRLPLEIDDVSAHDTALEWLRITESDSIAIRGIRSLLDREFVGRNHHRG